MSQAEIQERDVYYFTSVVLRGETEKPHYHAVIARGRYLHFGNSGFAVVVFSSYTPERYGYLSEKWGGRESIVILEPDDYEHLTHTTMIDCNMVHILGPEEMSGAERKTPISVDVHARIVEAIRKSEGVPRKITDLLKN